MHVMILVHAFDATERPVRIQQYDKATLLRHPMPSLYHAKASDRRLEISRQASYFIHNTLALHNIYNWLISKCSRERKKW